MKIRYSEFCPDPKLRNTETHQPAHIAQVLIAQGVATEVRLPRRGSPGWAEARMEQSRELCTAPSAGDTVVEFFKDPQWSVNETAIMGRPTIFCKHGYECVRFVGTTAADDAKRAGCPKSILKLYEDIVAKKSPDAIEAQRDRIAREQAEQQQRERIAMRVALAQST